MPAPFIVNRRWTITRDGPIVKPEIQETGPGTFLEALAKWGPGNQEGADGNMILSAKDLNEILEKKARHDHGRFNPKLTKG